MKLILFSQSRAAARHVDVSVPLVTVSGIGLVGLVAGLGFLVARAIGPVQPVADVSQLQHDVAAQQMALNAIEGRAQEQIDALTTHLASAGIRHRVEWYPGVEHGFAFPQREGIYDKLAAERHWERLFALFGRNLA